MNNAVANPTQPGLKDRLAESVVELVRGLVNGNGAVREDLQVDRLERKDRKVAVMLNIGIGWASANDTVPGGLSEQGSRLCRDRNSTVAALRADCEAAAADPVTAAELAKTLGKSPLAEFRSRQDGFKIRDLPHRYHCHEACGTCHGHGEHKCRGLLCRDGEVSCPRCSGDGREVCHNCSGSGSVMVQQQVRNYDGTYGYQNAYRTCGRCYGQRRVGNCITCLGQRFVPCPLCHGTAREACSPCRATGWFTHRSWTWLTGSVSRSLMFVPEDPAGFKEATKAVTITDLPEAYAETVGTAVTSGTGKCEVRLDCVVPHVRAEMRCNGVGIRIDAVGRSGKIPLMPTFLDELTADVLRDASRPAASPADAIKAARSTRLSHAILEHVSENRKFDPKLVVAKFSGAVSESVVRTLHNALDRSYDRLGYSGVRRAWLLGAPAIIAAAVVPAFYSQAGWLSPKTRGAIEWGLAIAPVTLVWLAAGASGRRGVRGTVGAGAARRPRQGAWPWAMAALALGLHIAVLGFYPGARSEGLPLAGAPPLAHRLGAADPAHGTPPAGQPAPPREGLLPSGLRRLAAKPEPPESEMRGTPAVWRLEANLAQLGVYSGPPDGVKGSPAMKRGLETLLQNIPDYKTMHIQEPFELTVGKVLHDEIRLALPANSTLASPLNNLARANLSHDDLSRLDAAAERAWKEPGKEQSWRSVDGRRGGRVVMAAPEASSGRGACGRFYIEVEVDGSADGAGPERACRNGAGWTPTH